jgi:hypothetical protein
MCYHLAVLLSYRHLLNYVHVSCGKIKIIIIGFTAVGLMCGSENMSHLEHHATFFPKTD